MTPSTTTQRWVLGLAALASFMVALDTLVVSTSLPTIQTDLHASLAQLEWTVNAYNLTLAALLLPAAALGDRLGRRRVFAVGLAAFSLASAACALSSSSGALIAFRAIQGGAAALVMPLAMALVGAAFPPEKRGSAMGVVQGLTGLSVASGPVIGGAISGGLDWQWIFWVNVPVGVLAVPLVLARVPESRGGDTRIDLRGVGLVTSAAFALVWGLVRANDAGWGSLEVGASLVAGCLLVVGLVIQQRRADEPLLPARLFAVPGFEASNIATACTFASLFSAVFFLAQFLQHTLGYDPLGAGLRLLPWTATLFFVAPVAGVLVDRVGPRPLITGGLTLQAAGMGWIALEAAAGSGYGAFIAPMMVAGCGISMAIPAGQAAVVGTTPVADVGKVSGISAMVRELAGVFGVAVAVAVFAGAGSYASPADFADGFSAALLVTAGLGLIGAVSALRLPAVAGEPAPVGV